jgi:hypothetical protein
MVLMAIVSLMASPVVDNGRSGRAPDWVLTKTLTDNHHIDVYNPQRKDRVGNKIPEHEQKQGLLRGDPQLYGEEHKHDGHAAHA